MMSTIGNLRKRKRGRKRMKKGGGRGKGRELEGADQDGNQTNRKEGSEASVKEDEEGGMQGTTERSDHE